MGKPNKKYATKVWVVPLRAGGFNAHYSIINIPAGTDERLELGAKYKTKDEAIKAATLKMNERMAELGVKFCED